MRRAMTKLVSMPNVNGPSLSTECMFSKKATVLVSNPIRQANQRGSIFRQLFEYLSSGKYGRVYQSVVWVFTIWHERGLTVQRLMMLIGCLRDSVAVWSRSRTRLFGVLPMIARLDKSPKKRRRTGERGK